MKREKKYLFLLILALSFISGNLFGKKISLSIDDCIFGEQNGKVRWEMYYSFDEDDLKYKLRDNGLIGELYFNVSIYSNIKLESEKKWVVSHIKNPDSLKTTKLMVGQKNFELNPGQYKVNIYAQDVNDSTSNLELNFDLIIANPSKENLFGSMSLQIAQLIEEDNNQKGVNEAFKKSGFLVMPLPSLIYLSENNNLYSYLEILSNQAGKGKDKREFNLQYSLYDSYKNLIKIKEKKVFQTNQIMIDTNQMLIRDVSTGTYYLKATIFAEANGRLDSQYVEKKFFIINKNKIANPNDRFLESISYERSEFAGLNEEQVKMEIEQIKPICSFQEIEQFDKLTSLDGKKRLLYRFWLNRDTDTTTIFNEELFRYRELVKFVDRNFSYGKTRGWQTDRGRVYLKYGKPSEREQHPFFGETRAYESWFYSEIQGGVYFHFVDMSGNGRYELVHSTAQFEVQYENWYNEYVLKNRTGYDPNDEYK
jgi:GWxTD domain-containing protein